jgi:spermidine synthase
MVTIAVGAPSRLRVAPIIFASAIFTSAALVFLVEPMIAKSILPLLGGSPAVWNACMAFFQLALLVGYGYAHLLQRFLAPRRQLIVHLVMLAAAALFLPIAATGVFGPPPVGAPLWWLFRVLLFSIGVPFAVLSATAPLLQAWYARAVHGAANPYVLYGASNLGSMLALLSYPIAVEPLLPLHEQARVWAGVYCLFCVLIVAAGAFVWRMAQGTAAQPFAAPAEPGSAVSWRARTMWVLLAAAPSSLMLGATTYISNDVASVPLFWIIPLALYLLTFVIAFQAEPIIGRDRALLWQAVFVCMAAGLFSVDTSSLFAHLTAYLGAFFFSALVCHQGLAISRPHPRHLTEFYLLISFGGVIGGIFNAFIAPVAFHTVLEFPLVLVLCCLARPQIGAAFDRKTAVLAAAGVGTAIALALIPEGLWSGMLAVAIAIAGAMIAGLLSGRVFAFTLAIGALCLQAVIVPPDKRTNLLIARSFFGVHRVTLGFEPALGGKLHLLFHGTTIHGAQPQAPQFRCQATTYYAAQGPIGQTYQAVLRTKPHANVGVVGLGSGTLATFTGPNSRMRFFEIDPEVERIARDPRYFTYLSECAKGRVDVVLGDARLTMAREPAHSYDLVQVDAFSADNIPTHLLTTQALAIYFRALKPDGLLMLHLSNRNLALEAPAAATAKAVGATALMQDFSPTAGTPGIAAAPSQVMILSRSPNALAAFARDPRWRPARDNGVRAWTDDYTNIVGALFDHAIATWH